MLRIKFHYALLALYEVIAMGIIAAMLFPIALLVYSGWFFLIHGSWPRVTACTFYNFTVSGGEGSIQSIAVCDVGTQLKGLNRILNYIVNDVELFISSWIALWVFFGLMLFITGKTRGNLDWLEANKRV